VSISLTLSTVYKAGYQPSIAIPKALFLITNFQIAHLRVAVSLLLKTRVSVQSLSWKYFFILIQIKLIFIWKAVVHLASFWRRDIFELECGLLSLGVRQGWSPLIPFSFYFRGRSPVIPFSFYFRGWSPLILFSFYFRGWSSLIPFSFYFRGWSPLIPFSFYFRGWSRLILFSFYFRGWSPNLYFV